MPYATEHAARQTAPGQYDREARKTLTPGVDAIMGFKAEQPSEIQSLRFDAEQFTPAEAKKWLSDHGFKTTVEAATVAKSAAQYGLQVVQKSEPLRFTLGVVYAPGDLDTQGEWTNAEEIRKAQWAFMKRLQSMAKSGAAIISAALAAGDAGVEVDLDDLLEKGAGLDIEHLQIEDDALGTVVSIFTAPVDLTINGRLVKEGSWLMGVEWNQETYARVVKGELNGFSMYGRVDRVIDEAVHV